MAADAETAQYMALGGVDTACNYEPPVGVVAHALCARSRHASSLASQSETTQPRLWASPHETLDVTPPRSTVSTS